MNFSFETVQLCRFCSVFFFFFAFQVFSIDTDTVTMYWLKSLLVALIFSLFLAVSREFFLSLSLSFENATTGFGIYRVKCGFGSIANVDVVWDYFCAPIVLIGEMLRLHGGETFGHIAWRIYCLSSSLSKVKFSHSPCFLFIFFHNFNLFHE
jgi:hypothetical protein